MTVLALLCAAPVSHAAPQEANGNSFVTLGTMGGPVPSPTRSQPANALLHGNNAYLVDTGDGTVGQLTKAGVRLGQVRAIILSHLHADHTVGLSAILALRNQMTIPGVITVYGPPGTRTLVAGIVASMQPAAQAGYGIPGQRWTAPEATVQVLELTHGSIILVDGITVTTAQNSHYDFVSGSADDLQFKSLSFRFDLPERSIVYTGDTGPSEAVERLAKGADILVTEMIDVDTTMATVRKTSPNLSTDAVRDIVQHLTTHHLTSEQVADLANRAGVKKVVVTHFAGGTPDAAAMTGYVRAIHGRFKGEVVLANDLDRF